MTTIEELKKQRSILQSAYKQLYNVRFIFDSRLQGSVDAISARISMLIDAINDRICEIAVEEGLDQLEELA